MVIQSNIDPRIVGLIGAAVTTVVAWARTRKTNTPVDDLTTRLRQPMRWALRHPVKALGRIARNRQ